MSFYTAQMNSAISNLLSSTSPLAIFVIIIIISSCLDYRSQIAESFQFQYPTADCLPGCTCSEATRQVDCRNQGWTELPRNFGRGAKSVDVSGNQIALVTSLNVEKAGLLEAIKLNFSGNGIEKVVDGAFAGMSSLQNLDLSWNNLTELGENTFHGCQLLLSVDVSFNGLKSVDGVFHDLQDLSRLDLQHNRITQLTQITFRDLVNLRYLILANNLISRIDKKTFKTLEKLTFLSLKGNPLIELTRLQFNSYHLSNIDLSNCKLQTVPRGLPNSIKYLQLSRNNLTILDRTSFQDCPYVTILILDDNSIVEIENGTFSKMIYLQQLWLNYNYLSKVPQNLPENLESLSLEANKIYILEPSDVSRTSKLSYLTLGTNLISDFSTGFFKALTELRHLDLSDNRIFAVRTGAFEANTKLKVLILSRNPIQSFGRECLRGLSRLSKLSLSFISTSVVHVGEDCFEDLHNLSSLSLESSYGLVQSIINSEALLKQLGSLRKLNLINTQLNRLRLNFSFHLPNLEQFQVTSSMWFCDRNIFWLKEVYDSGRMSAKMAEANRCHAPAHLKGRTVVSLTANDVKQHQQQQLQQPQLNNNTHSSAASTFAPYGSQEVQLPLFRIGNDDYDDDDEDSSDVDNRDDDFVTGNVKSRMSTYYDNSFQLKTKKPPRSGSDFSIQQRVNSKPGANNIYPSNTRTKAKLDPVEFPMESSREKKKEEGGHDERTSLVQSQPNVATNSSSRKNPIKSGSLSGKPRHHQPSHNVSHLLGNSLIDEPGFPKRDRLNSSSSSSSVSSRFFFPLSQSRWSDLTTIEAVPKPSKSVVFYSSLSREQQKLNSSAFLFGAIVMVIILILLTVALALYCVFNSQINKRRQRRQRSPPTSASPTARATTTTSLLRRFFKNRRKSSKTLQLSGDNQTEETRLNAVQEASHDVSTGVAGVGSGGGGEASIALIPARDIYHEGPKRVYTWTDF